MARLGNIVGGKYRLTDAVGEGAMGAVWKAQHETLGRPFAVKFLKAHGLSSHRLEERFFPEARLAAAVRHRFVVDIVDFGVTDEGTPYMVMEYLEGQSLACRLRAQPALGVRDLLRLLGQTMVGLEAVHQAGIIHRDVKPENIVLTADAGGIYPKLVDFGISLPDPDRGTRGSQARLTYPGVALGTPWYMSPEQVRGTGAVDRRTDIYSVGVIAYEALAGVMPFDDEDLTALLQAVVAGGAPPLEALRPDLPATLTAVVARAMATDPARRFSDAAGMARALLAVADAVPETAPCRVRPARDGPGTGENPAPEPGPAAVSAAPRGASRPGRTVPAILSSLLPSSRVTRVRTAGRARSVVFGLGVVALAAVASTAVGLTYRGEERPAPRAPRALPVAPAGSEPFPMPRVLPDLPGPSSAEREPLRSGPLPPRQFDTRVRDTDTRAQRVRGRPRPRGADSTSRRPPEVFRDPGF